MISDVLYGGEEATQVSVGESNVRIWGMNITSRGNSQMERQECIWSIQRTERISVCGGQSKPSGDEEERKCELQFKRLLKEEEEEEEKQQLPKLYAPHGLKYIKSAKCFPTPDTKYLAGSRSSTKL